MDKVGPLTAARKPAAGSTRRKSRLKRSQPLEQVSANPDMTYEVRKYINRIIINIFFLSNSDLL
jgi:hypothetical protein